MTEQISRMYSESSQNTQVKTESVKQTKKKELEKERVSAKKKENASDVKGTEQEKKERMLAEKKIKQAIDEANQKTKFSKKSFEYAVDDRTNRISITVRDQETNEVIREIPSEETLNMVAKIWELAGIIVDEKM